MSDTFLRPAYDPWCPPDSVSRHVGRRQDFVTRAKSSIIRAVGQGKEATKAIGPKLIKWIYDARMLREAWDSLAAKGDTAPGPNGRRYDDLDDPEVWELLRTIGQAIHDDTYRMGDEQEVQIPKDRLDPTRGTRPISLINVEDRTVQRTVVDVLQPLLDQLFGRNILGYRPGHDRLHALALAEQVAFGGDRHVFLVEDLKDAFTRVPVQRLLDILAVYIPSGEVLGLIKHLLDTGRKHGIRQGGPLSPLLLNVYLHHVFDKPWRKDWSTVPMIRVADDLLFLCRTKKEAAQARAGLESLLTPANMPLKESPKGSVFDLRKGMFVEWLGFEIRRGDEALAVGVAEKAWTRLDEHLTLAHEKPDAAISAMATINGWIDALGPCYPFVSCPRIYERLVKLAAKQAFDEIPSRDAVTSRWRRAYERWCDIRNDVRERPEVLNSVWAPRPVDGPPGASRQTDTGFNGESSPVKTGAGAVAPWE